MGTGSLVETIAATIVETLLALLVATAVVATLATTATTVEKARATAELARFELVLIDACGRVLRPPGASGQVAVTTVVRTTAGASATGSSVPAVGRRFEVGLVDGEPEGRLVIVAGEGGVRLSVVGVEHRFDSLRIERMEVERRRVPHLSLTVRAGRSRLHEVRAPFGSFAPL